MSTSQPAAASERGPLSIVVEYPVAQPPEQVWRALTEPDLLAGWLMQNDIRPVVGHRFTMHAKPVPGWDGTVYCEVLTVDRPRTLSYSWRGGAKGLDRGAGPVLDTVVTWTLTPTPNGGTLLRLDHAGFEPGSFAYETMGRGWRGHLAQRITEVLAAA